jgi:hypothetical protein
MTAFDIVLIKVLSRSKNVRRFLQRWAMRYSARLLHKLGGPHKYSADLLEQLGTDLGRGNTMTGRPIPKRPANGAAEIATPRTRTVRVPPLPSLYPGPVTPTDPDPFGDS